MALKGTLKDFGIADILQLIGQQQKTGVLSVTNRGDVVSVTFKDGTIVRAESQSRNRRDLIGRMLVNANLISESQLEFALDVQRRTLQRLGDVLVSQAVITSEKFAAMVQLQTSETLYRLFNWNSGTYEFEQKDVELDGTLTALRAESVLMEGFRRVDEWPVVRKRITSLQMTFERLRDLPPRELAKDAFDAALDDAFGEQKKEVSKGEFQSIGDNERVCYELVAPGRTLQRIIELSCLGEFETAKALCNLVNLAYLAGNAPVGKKGADDFEGDLRPNPVLAVLGRVGVGALIAGALAFIAAQVDYGAVRLGGPSGTTYTDPAAQRFVSRQQLSRIEAALELFRLEKGTLPNGLFELVEVGLLSQDDLRYPWREDYYYRRTANGAYVLLPPVR